MFGLLPFNLIKYGVTSLVTFYRVQEAEPCNKRNYKYKGENIMKFTLDKDIELPLQEQAVGRMFEMLATARSMALASSLNDYVMVRNVGTCSMTKDLF